MLLTDQNNMLAKPRSIQVFASDIDESAIGTARAGRYPGSIITDVTPTRLRQYCDRQDEYCCVKRAIREKVLFAIHNILQDPPFSRLHLIVCRNLLIYLDREVQTKVLENLHYALQPNGYLFLGTAESAESVARYFKPVDKKNRIYRAAHIRSETLFHTPPLISRSERVPVKASKDSAERRRIAPQDLYQKLVESSGPPGILIDQNHQIIYATKQAWRFLRQSGGEPSHDIMATLHPDLQLEFRAALLRHLERLFRLDKKAAPAAQPGHDVRQRELADLVLDVVAACQLRGVGLGRVHHLFRLLRHLLFERCARVQLAEGRSREFRDLTKSCLFIARRCRGWLVSALPGGSARAAARMGGSRADGVDNPAPCAYGHKAMFPCDSDEKRMVR
jgi:PAS domain-containing protein